jgi:hypothetical protein
MYAMAIVGSFSYSLLLLGTTTTAAAGVAN